MLQSTADMAQDMGPCEDRKDVAAGAEVVAPAAALVAAAAAEAAAAAAAAAASRRVGKQASNLAMCKTARRPL